VTAGRSFPRPFLTHPNPIPPRLGNVCIIMWYMWVGGNASVEWLSACVSVVADNMQFNYRTPMPTNNNNEGRSGLSGFHKQILLPNHILRNK